MDNMQKAPASEQLKNTTLIIPTFNRGQFLQRLLKYYASKSTDLNYIILDSSEENIAIQNKKNVALLKEKAKYFYFPTSTSPATKLLAGIKKVATPFLAFCADDDLVFLDSLKKAVYHLASNAEYVCVDGIYLNFNPHGFNLNLHLEYSSAGIYENLLANRIFQLFQKYESLFYGVFRTHHAHMIFEGVVSNESLHYQELFQAVAALILGKTYRLPIFYAARQHCAAAEPNRDKWQTYYWFAEHPEEFIAHYIHYRNNLWDFYNHSLPEMAYAKNDFFNMLDITHAMYFGIGCPPKYFYSVLQSKYALPPFKENKNNMHMGLKKPLRVKWENFLKNFQENLEKLKFLSLKNKSLDKYIKMHTQKPWKCCLEEELYWLIHNKEFKQSYIELCCYLSVEH